MSTFQRFDVASPRKVAVKGHGCMGQRGGPMCGESGRNALLEDGSSIVFEGDFNAYVSGLQLGADVSLVRKWGCGVRNVSRLQRPLRVV